MLVRHLPADAHTIALIAGPAAAWRLEHYLLADLVQVQTGKPHPGRPTPAQLQRGSGHPSKSARQDRMLRAQQRRIERQQAAQEAPTD